MGGSILDESELIKQQNTRTFIQYGGPGNKLYFFGIGTQYHFIDGMEIPTNGDIEPIFVPDPRRPGRYRLASRSLGAPDLPTVDLIFHEKWGGVPHTLMAPECDFNLYEVHGRCGDLSDLYRGWESYLNIYSYLKLTGNVDGGSRSSREDDEPLENSVSATGVAIYPVGALSFGSEADPEVAVEVIDVVYGTSITCGSCGVENDGSNHIYALTRANVGSPAAPGQLIYSTDGGQTWTPAAITGIGSSNEPRYIDIAGGILFVGTAGTTLFYTALDPDTAAPTTWSQVTLPVAMNDVYVQSASAIFFAANSGAVYKTTDIAIAPSVVANGAGSDNLTRIHGQGETIVAVGAAGRVYASINNGATWSSTVVPAAVALTAISVLDRRTYWVGTTGGALYKTMNGGKSWTSVAFPGSGSGSIFDILFATREVAWIAHQASSVAYLITTLDGGNSWARNDSTSRILNWPTFQKAGRLAAPVEAKPAVAANYLAVAGLAAGGADGLLVAGSPTII